MNTLSANQVFLRDYTKIYTGTNQEGGYENPFLGFITDTVEVIFKTDKSTYFHYPKTAELMYLSATDLIGSGAFAGSIPFKADKIFKKQADYENHIPWGNSYTYERQRGVWLCTWLSGNDSDPTQMPVWMDRWYDPGVLDATHTMFTSSNSAVYDKLSVMTFDPGVWYRYDHIGSNANSQIVNMICCLKLHVDEWVDDIPVDTSGYENKIYLQNYTPSCKSVGVNASGISLKLNGINQYGSVLYNSLFDVNTDLSCNIWVNANDWQNQSSHHFLSNGLRGGWSIGVNTGFFNPFNVLLDSSGNVIFNNQTGNFYKDIILPGSTNPISFAIDSELYTWVLDNGIYDGYKHLYKIDYNGNIDNAVYFSSGINLCDVIIDNNLFVWVTDGTRLSAFNTYCELVGTNIIPGTKLLLNSSNTLTAFNATDACVFENIYYWTIENGDVFYNSSSTGKINALSGLNASNVQCTNDFIWVLFDDDKIAQFKKNIDTLTYDVSFSSDLSARITDTVSLSITGRNIFFTNEYVNGVNKEYVWILQPNTEYLYKYDTSLNMVQKMNTSYVKNSIKSSAVKGDASGYQWQRLFNYGTLNVSSMSQIEACAYLTTNNSISIQKYKAVIPVSALSVNDWHMFTFSIDNSNNELRLYMDSILRDTVDIPVSSTIFYKYETPLLIGSNVGQINTLDEELNDIERIYHLGGFDDLRIYTCLLNNSDIRHIYLTKFNFNDLIWNMPTGDQSYVEEIVRFFKFKMPGQKSQYYNIHLNGLQIYDNDVRKIIEDIIKDSIQKIAPLYTSLYKIVWD